MKHNSNKINNEMAALIEKVQNTCLFSLNTKDNLYKLSTSMTQWAHTWTFDKKLIFSFGQFDDII